MDAKRGQNALLFEVSGSLEKESPVCILAMKKEEGFYVLHRRIRTSSPS